MNKQKESKTDWEVRLTGCISLHHPNCNITNGDSCDCRDMPNLIAFIKKEIEEAINFTYKNIWLRGSYPCDCAPNRECEGCRVDRLRMIRLLNAKNMDNEL